MKTVVWTYKYKSFGTEKEYSVEANTERVADQKVKVDIKKGKASPDVWQQFISVTQSSVEK
jgi:hypothetical protein